MDVDRTLFRELIEVKQSIAPGELQGGPRGLVVSLSLAPKVSRIKVSEGHIECTRFENFEKLRDVITRYRRAWADTHLDNYLHNRWSGEIRAAADTYSRLTAVSNKSPPAKVFARKVKPTIDRWFGGDTSDLYTSIGAKCSVKVNRAIRRIPADPCAFRANFVVAIKPAVRTELGLFEEHSRVRTEVQLRGLARLALRALQLSEALGFMPTLKELGKEKFAGAQCVRYPARNYSPEMILDANQEQAYGKFISAIEFATKSPLNP